MKRLAVILAVILNACESKPPGSELGSGFNDSRFDLVDYLLQNKLLYWENDSMTFIYKGEKHTSRYGTIKEGSRGSFPHNAYSNCHLCGYLLFEKKELNTLYQSFCSSPFFIKIIDDEGVIRYYNEAGFGHNPDPDDGILRFKVAESFIDGVITYYKEYQGKVYSSRWYTSKEGIIVLENNEANEIYQRYQQSPCRSLIVYPDKSQTLVFPKKCN